MNAKLAVVTGGSGFIGSHLIAHLTELGFRVASLDIAPPSVMLPRVEYVTGDVRDAGAVLPLVRKATIVYHLAAEVSVPLCDRDPLESTSVNFDGVLTVLDCLRKKREEDSAPTTFVFASSSAVYGDLGSSRPFLKESDPLPPPRSFYGMQKASAETAIKLYHERFGIPAVSFRFFNVYGPGQKWDSPYSGVITRFARALLRNEPLTIFGDGEQTRDFVYIEDVVRALGAVSASHGWDARVFNVGTGTPTTVKRLASTISRVTGTRVPVGHADARDGDVRHSCADTSNTEAALGWKPLTSFDRGLESVLEFLRTKENDACKIPTPNIDSIHYGKHT